MFHNHGWGATNSVTKRVRQAKKPTKRNPDVSQKDHLKCIWPAKTTTKFKLQKQ